MNERVRGERLQIMLTESELAALDDWRFTRRMPSRAAAVRELLRRGLASEGVSLTNTRMRSKDFSVTEDQSQGGHDGSGRGNGHDRTNGHDRCNGDGADL
jgi:hypothetical protein